MKKIFRGHLWILLILTIGLLLRIYSIHLPLLDAKPHREIHTAEETRNLFYNPSSLFYPTSKLWADEPGYYIVEFPIYNSLVALFYFITGAVNETYGRIISVAASVGVAIFFYKLVSIHFTKSIAIWSTGFMYLVSPQEIILSRSFQPDQLGFFLGIFSLYNFSLWISSGKKSEFIISLIALSLTFLVKISFFPFTFPMIYLVIKKWGMSSFRRPAVWLYAAAVIPTFIWYNHVRNVYLSYPLLHSGKLIDPSDWLVFQQLLNPHWYANIFYDFSEQIITVPVGLLILCALLLKQKVNSVFVYVWLFGTVVYGFLFIGKIHFWYYQVPFVFPLVILASITMVTIEKYLHHKIKFIKVSGIVFMMVLMISTAKPYLLRTYVISPRHEHVLETATQVKKLAPANSKILASSHNSGALTYYALRQDMWGGTFLLQDSSCDTQCMVIRLEEMRSWGATLFAISDKSELKYNSEFEEYIRFNYKVLSETNYFVIFDLTLKSS